jgi:hypothetical protein
MGVRFGEGGRMAFDLSHGLPVVDSLVANRAFVEVERSNRVGPTLKAAGPVAPHLSDFGATARRADRDLWRIHLFSDSLLGRDQKIVRFGLRLPHEFAFRVNHQPLQIGALNDIKVLFGLHTQSTL